MHTIFMNRKSFIGRPAKDRIDWATACIIAAVVLIAVVIFMGDK